MVVTFSEMVSSPVRPVQPLKADEPILFSVLGNLMEVIFV